MKLINGIKCNQSCYLLVLAICFFLSFYSIADDTELYVTSGGAKSSLRPQILIIFDNSGSMENNSQYEKTFFKSEQTLTPDSKIFFSSTSEVPDPASEQFFLHSKNRCNTSIQYLNNYGLFTGYLRDYKFIGQTGAWREMSGSNSTTITDVDCFEDIFEKDINNNSSFTGLPVDHLGSPTAPIRYSIVNPGDDSSVLNSAYEKALLTNFGVGKSINLFTQEYVEWYHSETVPEKLYKRIDIARDVIKKVIVTTPGADIGLAIFNGEDEQGGRIVNGIKQITNDTRDELLATIPTLSVERRTTPLCETLYEAYLYFSGRNVHYGDNSASVLPRDTSIESGGVYDTPLKECQSNVYVIIITDGYPYTDVDADEQVKLLPGISQTPFEIVEKNNRKTFLPNLAEWMANNDINSSIDGKQIAITSTIGFSSGVVDSEDGVLSVTALRGGGQYASADDTKELQSAITALVNVALENGSSFTSPSVASNNFDRTRTLNSIYYAMFLPNEGPRWSGNLKRFKVEANGSVVDQNGFPALDTNGSIKSTACSFWSSCSDGADGGDVLRGGAAEFVRAKAGSDGGRTILSNLANGLAPLTNSSAQSTAGSAESLATHMNVDETEVEALFAWIKGKDLVSSSGEEPVEVVRQDIIGDPLHSRPLAINYSTSRDETDVRILMGTNHGFLHMFKDSGEHIDESWAFMPFELLSNVAELKANVATGVHTVYGIDSSPISYIERNGASISKAWVFFGMRRGGASYYALDITNPDSPRLMWLKDSLNWGSELGQSWSEPVVTRIPGHSGPVLIIGAGYAPQTKDLTSVGQNDIRGRGVFIVDAATGDIIHHFGRGGGDNFSVTEIPTLVDSIPNAVAKLDSDADGKTDRLYASDTGGNVWRMDMPSADKSTWSAFKFAALGGSLPSTDRRFFSEPTVAQTVIMNTVSVTDAESNTQYFTQNIPYDAVVIGSGLRPSPNNTQRTDMFFTLQDRNIETKTFNSSNTPNALIVSNLYPVASGAPETPTQRVEFSTKLGWYYQFGSAGEKSLSAATIIDGRVFFSSFVPSAGVGTNQCTISGEGRIYALDLHFGKRTFYRNNAEYKVVDGIPDTPQIVIPSDIVTDDQGNPIISDEPLNKYIIGETKSVGEVKQVKSHYYYVEENN
ncbi:rRNA (guanine-N1)-methyltransferase [Shewanella sp. 202IG2-18]|uniref:pilus assembly protein n=1 Tax=Parashewanella hymeniacidonis TaxID=2807618 RepID=UPI0019611D40|nr:PilC/PilY family type IV pilus protein [Parashewanella hymeniacidonis]MBM7071565.1 rRNA (guanine-N1)-methyltransferase [Parashewanella hymeniacidonis]